MEPTTRPDDALRQTKVVRRSWWSLGHSLRRVVDVERPASELDPASIPRFREAFARSSRWHRWRHVAGFFATFVGFFATFGVLCGLAEQAVSFGLVDASSIEKDIFAFVGMIVALAAPYAIDHRIGARCPHCRCSVDDLGRFCPLCGERSLRLKPTPHCTSCTSELRWDWCTRSHEREYRVHHCSACGLSICPDGVP